MNTYIPTTYMYPLYTSGRMYRATIKASISSRLSWIVVAVVVDVDVWNLSE